MAKERYLKQVLRHLSVNRKTKNRIKEDLIESLYNDPEDINYDELIMRHGSPKELAEEFMSNLQVDENIVRKGMRFEYKSDIEFVGIPLIHINTNQRGIAIAKGVIAIGDISIGIISIGGLSFGILSLGGLSLGIMALGGMTMGVFSIGGIAIGLYAIGGIAIGLVEAIGGLVKYLSF